MMKAYDSLATFDDVQPALAMLKQYVDSGDIEAVIFSNGTRDMVHVSLSESPSFAPSYALFNDVVLIDEMPEETRKYKPAPETYQYLKEKVQQEAKSVWLVSSNPFDIVGCKDSGLKAAWVDRGGVGWVDDLGSLLEQGAPDIAAKGVDIALREIIVSEGILT
jgi:2-haloacid dehalogenase